MYIIYIINHINNIYSIYMMMFIYFNYIYTTIHYISTNISSNKKTKTCI